MIASQRETLRLVRRVSTDELVRLLREAESPGTIEEIMARRWTALAVLGELLRRDEIDRLTGKLSLI